MIKSSLCYTLPACVRVCVCIYLPLRSLYSDVSPPASPELALSLSLSSPSFPLRARWAFYVCIQYVCACVSDIAISGITLGKDSIRAFLYCRERDVLRKRCMYLSCWAHAPLSIFYSCKIYKITQGFYINGIYLLFRLKCVAFEGMYNYYRRASARRGTRFECKKLYRRNIFVWIAVIWDIYWRLILTAHMYGAQNPDTFFCNVLRKLFYCMSINMRFPRLELMMIFNLYLGILL